MHNSNNQNSQVSPRQSNANNKQSSLKTVLSGGATGKKTTGSFKQSTVADAGDQQVVIGSANNLILSRGRPAQIENTARAAANMHTSTGQMNFSKTLTQHMQN